MFESTVFILIVMSFFFPSLYVFFHIKHIYIHVSFKHEPEDNLSWFYVTNEDMGCICLPVSVFDGVAVS